MAKKSTTTASKKPAKKTLSTNSVKVKTFPELLKNIDSKLHYYVHDRFNASLSKKTQQKIVAYGPWLSAVLVLIILPELIMFAKTGSLLTFTGFFDSIFFNQQSWVVMLVFLANILLLVDGLSQIFEKKLRGWQRIYQATLLSGIYILWQLLDQITNPAAPLVSLLSIGLILFTLFNIRSYYK
jgi:hypothetical protein